MNNLYVICNENPIQQIENAGLIQDRYDLKGIDDSLPLDLDDSDGKKMVERRYHKRFQLKEDAFALVRPVSVAQLKIQGKSMGCIACAVFNAKPVKLGKIDNISLGGLMFQYADCNPNISKVLVLDILSADCGFYLANVPYKIISDVCLTS